MFSSSLRVSFNLPVNVPLFCSLRFLSNLIGIKWNYLKKIIKSPEKYYYNFRISKKSGGEREINVPNKALSLCQNFIKDDILDTVNIHSSANGFAFSKSIITNAKEHTNKEMVLNIDLKDFFPFNKF